MGMLSFSVVAIIVSFIFMVVWSNHGTLSHLWRSDKQSCITTLVKSTSLASLVDSTRSSTAGVAFNSPRSAYVQKRLPPTMAAFKDVSAPFVGCIYSDRMRFIYLKTAKSAGSTILLGWLRPSLCPSTSDSDRFTGWGSGKSNFSKSCDDTLLYPPPGQDSSACADIPMWKWQQYFVFTTVRNPYERMRSSYNYCRSKLPWSVFCTDPTLTEWCPSPKNLTGVRKTNNHYQFPISWAYRGWWGWHVDYIIRLEDMAQGVYEVAQHLNCEAAERGEKVRLAGAFTNVNVQNMTQRDELCSSYTGPLVSCAQYLESTQDPEILGYTNFCHDRWRSLKLDGVKG